MARARILNPPHYVLILSAVEVALARYFPVAVLPSLVRMVGGAVIAFGLAFVIWAATWFRRKKTGIVPFSDSTALITEGPYRFSRNPIYAGMTLILIGLALALGGASALICPIIFMVIITWRFILPEEAHMERAFGESYLSLKQQVRRWL